MKASDSGLLWTFVCEALQVDARLMRGCVLDCEDSEDMSRNDVVVAVDFGTTRTAYAITHQGMAEDDIEVGVPSGSNTTSTVYDAKTPSTILIDASSTKVLAYGYAAEERCAVKKDQGVMLFRYFKMELHNPSSQDPSVEALNGKSLRLSEVLAKALEYVKKDVVRKLNGNGLTVQATDIVWVITVPAIWNDWARQMMRAAAHAAGMTSEIHSQRLKLALEPECACVSVQMEKIQGVLSEPGQKLMILDCGGGTIDMTAHQVEAVDPLRLKELMAPAGGPFGGTQVDENFYRFFSDLIGNDRFETLKQTKAFLSLSRCWEDKKMTFTGQENEDDQWFAMLNIGEVVLSLDMAFEVEGLVANWNANNPSSKAEAFSLSILGLSFNLMMSFFEGPVERIVDKLNAAMTSPLSSAALKDISLVVIAGGFSRSPVLQKRVKENFDGKPVKVVVCRHPDLAIVKGAAAFGARPSVFESRKAKYTYGIGCSVVFDASKPLHEEYRGRKYVGMDGKVRLDIFDVHGRAGDDIPVGGKSKRRRYCAATDDQGEIVFSILISKDPDVFLWEDSGVQELGSWTLKVDMSVPFEERWYQVEYLFGETETVCKFYKESDPEVEVHDIEVKFPSDVHWAPPTSN
eukprot:evm.model.scf_225.2 EVM.evm.TU.scf_225.2   scf_225:108068-110896(+)